MMLSCPPKQKSDFCLLYLFWLIFFIYIKNNELLVSRWYSLDGLSVLCSPALLGGRLGPGSRCWQGRRLDQPDSLSSGLSQQPPGSHLPGCRNGYVGVLLLLIKIHVHFLLIFLLLLLLLFEPPKLFFYYSKIWNCGKHLILINININTLPL